MIYAGFMDGWVHDEKCIARQADIQGHILPVANIKHYSATDKYIAAVVSGEVGRL